MTKHEQLHRERLERDVRALIAVYGPELVCKVAKAELAKADDIHMQAKYVLTPEEEQALLEDQVAAQMDDIKERTVWDLMFDHLYSWELKQLAKEVLEDREEGGPC